MISASSDALTQQTIVAAGIITAAVGVITAYIYRKIRKNWPPTEWEAVGKVAKLRIYPLKSGRRLEVEKAECTKQGLMEQEKFDKTLRLRDRSFVVYNEGNLEYRTARHYPKMMRVETEAHDMNCVKFNAPKMNTLYLTLPSKNDHEEVVIKHHKQEEITSIDCGDDAAAWISQYILGIDKGLRLAYHDGSYKRTQINKLYKDKIKYDKRGLRNESTGLASDLGAVHIINNASVLPLKLYDSEVTVENFRPNLVVEGPNLQPFVEDNWDWVKVGGVVMKNVGECTRCVMCTIDPETGIRNCNREPLKFMEKFRMSKGPDKTPVMGILLEVFQTGLLSVDDTVYVGKSC